MTRDPVRKKVEGGERPRVVRMSVSAKSEKERLVRGATSREAVVLRSGASSREERIDLMKEGKIEEGPPELVGELATIRTIEPAGINAVAEDEWVEIAIAVDSGATEPVMSEETLNVVIGITESAACKRGTVYETADG